MHRKIEWATVDFSKTDRELGLELDVAPGTVRRARKRLKKSSEGVAYNYGGPWYYGGTDLDAALEELRHLGVNCTESKG